MKRFESPIRRHLEGCIKELKEQKKCMHDQIQKWQADSIREIKRHATEQELILTKELDNQKSNIEVAQMQQLAKVKVLYEGDDQRALKQLMDRCTRLKYSLGRLTVSEGPLKWLRLEQGNRVEANEHDMTNGEAEERRSIKGVKQQHENSATADGRSPTNAQSK